MQLLSALRRITRLTLSTTLIAGIASVPALGQGTNLVTNGGFEAVTNGYPDGWTLDNGNCFLHQGSDIQQNAAHSGTYGAEFGANYCQDGYSQSLATLAGQKYTVSFFARAGSNAQPNTLQLFFGGNSIFSQGITNGDFLQFTTTATATSGSTLFDVQGGHVTGQGYINFDDVSVSAMTTAPEPSSMALLGTGLFGLIPMLRRKRNRE